MTPASTPRTRSGSGAPLSSADSLNACDFLLDRRVREGDGDRPAVLGDGRALTYSDLAAEVRGVAAALMATGVRPEERVVFFMADRVELMAGILAAMRIGAVPVPVSTMLTDKDLGALLHDSRARVLFVSEEFVETARTAVSATPEVTDVVVAGDVRLDVRTRARWQEWDQFLESGAVFAAGAADPLPTPADSTALWLYTSGTTGSPKAAVHSHRNITFVADTYGRQVLGIHPDDRCLSVAKLFFAYGIGNSMFFPLSVGATTILEAVRPTPAGIAERVRAERPTLFFGVPTFYGALLASDIPDDTFASVRQGVSAGEPLPPTIFARFRERFGVEILDGIGSTEALHIFLSNRSGEVRAGTTGVPVPGYEMQLRDDDGSVITEADRPGNLFVQGGSTAQGYWCRAETTKQVFQGEWLRTGDTYQRNEDGTYTCLGRSDDMLKAGGIWVSPGEVEERLLQHPAVAEAAVVGEPDTDGLHKPVACVVPKQGHDVAPEDLISHCRSGLASFKRPRRIAVLTSLPRTATGKIRRNAVRAMLAEDPTLLSEPDALVAEPGPSPA